jgi:hypothetical protein
LSIIPQFIPPPPACIGCIGFIGLIAFIKSAVNFAINDFDLCDDDEPFFDFVDFDTTTTGVMILVVITAVFFGAAIWVEGFVVILTFGTDFPCNNVVDIIIGTIRINVIVRILVYS